MGEESTATRLPVPLTSLIGRQADVERVLAVLDSGARLVTLTGPGGVGKTRLALEVTRLAASSYAHGGSFISLEALDRPDQVYPRIMNELGISESPGRTALEDLGAGLADKHMLLCIDNWEQVIEAAGDLARLLSACPRVQVIATSREALRLRGEQEYPLQPLDLGGQGDPAASLAVQLFLERAKLAQPNLVLDGKTAAAAGEICRLLDGLPLAIELSAALLRIFSPAALLARLQSHSGLAGSPAAMHVLTGGARDLPDRHKTLRSTIAWSYRLLKPPEQRLFRWLAVFPAGCDLEAAQAVCSDPPGEGGVVFEHLLSLADKHLVESDTSGGETRFRMLRTIQEYALEQLEQAGELEQARARHARRYLDLVFRAEDELFGPKRGEWLSRFQLEYDNLGVMLEWAIRNRRVEEAYRVSGTLWRFWLALGHGREGRQWFERILALPGELPLIVRANAINGAGAMAFHQGDFPAARTLMTEALNLRKEAGDRAGMAASNHNLGQLAFRLGDFDAALSFARESLVYDRETGDLSGVASGYYFIGMIYNSKNEPEAAEEQVKLGLPISQKIGDQWQIGLAHDLLGSITYSQKRYDQARNHYGQAKMAFEEIGDLDRVPFIEGSLGMIALHEGNLAEAETRLTNSLKADQESGDLWGTTSTLGGVAFLAAAKGNRVKAARLWGAVEKLQKQIGSTQTSLDAKDIERFIGPARANLTEKVFQAEMESGAAMSLDEAIRYALAAGEEASAAPPAAARKALPGGLTAREAEILRCVADGLTDQEVAEKLVISPRTVNAHLTSVYGKLGVSSRAAATRFALENGLAA